MLLHEEAEKIWKDYIGKYNLEPTILAAVAMGVLVLFAMVWDFAAVSATVAMLVALSPIWLPFFIGVALYITWIHMTRYQYWFSREYGLMEIQLPAEVTKSPAAMEVFLSSFWTSGGETTYFNRFWGGVKSSWTLEIASNEGRISFYMYTLKAWQPAVEARLYGQFPDAQVRVIDDYVPKVAFNLEEYDIWGAEYMKDSPQALPIKTYLDFELDKDTDNPDTKVDPITNILELMNNIGPDQYLWYQIIMRAHTKDDWYGFKNAKDHYVEEANSAIKKIMAGAAKRAGDVLKENDIVEGKMNALLTDNEKDKVKAMEHSFTKNAFDVGIRVLYIAKKEKFSGIWGAYLFRMFQVFKGLNQLGGKGGRAMVQFDYPWEDFGNIRQNMIKKMLYFHYKYRAYYSVPYDQVPSVMTTEEVATLWHFPTSTVKTPGLNRVPSKTSEAPPNLPLLPQ